MTFTGLIEYLWVFGLGVFIFILGFIATQEYFKRINSEKRAGQEILDADMDIDHSRSVELLMPIEKIETFVETPASLQNAVNDFTKGMGKVFKQLPKKELDKKIKKLDDSLDRKLLTIKEPEVFQEIEN